MYRFLVNYKYRTLTSALYTKFARSLAASTAGAHSLLPTFWSKSLGTSSVLYSFSSAGTGRLDTRQTELDTPTSCSESSTLCITPRSRSLLPLSRQVLRSGIFCSRHFSHSSSHCERFFYYSRTFTDLVSLVMACSNLSDSYIGGNGCTVCHPTPTSSRVSWAKVITLAIWSTSD